MRRPLPWIGQGSPATVRVLVTSTDTLFAEAVAVCLQANDGLEVAGIAFDADTMLRATEVLRPTVAVVDKRLGGVATSELHHAVRERWPQVRTVLLASTIGPTAGEVAVFDAIVPPGSSLDRVVASVREVAWQAHVPSSTDGASTPGPTLSDRELEVLRLLARGVATEAVADRLHLSVHTVRNHVRNAMRKLRVHSRVEAVAEAGRRSLL